jgi:hypothetical protein
LRGRHMIEKTGYLTKREKQRESVNSKERTVHQACEINCPDGASVTHSQACKTVIITGPFTSLSWLEDELYQIKGVKQER